MADSLGRTIILGVALSAKHQRYLRAAEGYLQVSEQLLAINVEGKLQDLARVMVISVTETYRSVRLLLEHAQWADAFRLTRPMFESAVTLKYLATHPEQVDDYMDFIWILRHRHNEYRQSQGLDIPVSIAPELVEQAKAEFSQVQARFKDKKGRIRTRWSSKSLKDMAREVEAEPLYGAVYPYASSLQHADILGVMAGVGNAADAGEAPWANLAFLSISNAALSLARILQAANEICDAKLDDHLSSVFNQLKESQVED